MIIKIIYKTGIANINEDALSGIPRVQKTTDCRPKILEQQSESSTNVNEENENMEIHTQTESSKYAIIELFFLKIDK